MRMIYATKTESAADLTGSEERAHPGNVSRRFSAATLSCEVYEATMQRLSFLA